MVTTRSSFSRTRCATGKNSTTNQITPVSRKINSIAMEATITVLVDTTTTAVVEEAIDGVPIIDPNRKIIRIGVGFGSR